MKESRKKTKYSRDAKNTEKIYKGIEEYEGDQKEVFEELKETTTISSIIKDLY